MKAYSALAELSRYLIKPYSFGSAVEWIRAASAWSPRPAAARLIGPPNDGRATGVRLIRWVRLEGSGMRLIEHQPRRRW